MSHSSTLPRRRRAPRSRSALLAALLLAAGVAHARGTSQGFDVGVKLNATQSTATCSESTLPGATTKVSITCGQAKSPSTPPTHLLLHIFRAEEWVGTVDGFMTTGTVTSWRVVRLAQREYLEMTVGW